jgi:hypothetical protein
LGGGVGGSEGLAIGPSDFHAAAVPLVTLRRNEGLRVKFAAIEEVYSEFGFGETTPVALRDFLAYATHHWNVPPRYVVLLGDATYDFKDRLGTGVAAADVEEVKTMVDKIVAFETSGKALYGRFVLVTDNPDGAGNFQANAEELSGAEREGAEKDLSRRLRRGRHSSGDPGRLRRRRLAHELHRPRRHSAVG